MVPLAGLRLPSKAGIITRPRAQKLGYKKIIKENFPRSTGGWQASLSANTRPRDLHNESKLRLGWQWAQRARERASPRLPFPAAPAELGPRAAAGPGTPSPRAPENAGKPRGPLPSLQMHLVQMTTDSPAVCWPASACLLRPSLTGGETESGVGRGVRLCPRGPGCQVPGGGVSPPLREAHHDL